MKHKDTEEASPLCAHFMYSV